MSPNALGAVAATEPDEVELEPWIVIDPLVLALFGLAVVLLAVAAGIVVARRRRQRADRVQPTGDEPDVQSLGDR